MYGAETWRATKALERKLDMFENRVLRKLCGPVMEATQCGAAWLSDMVRSQRMRGAGHVARKEDGSLVKTAMMEMPAGRRPVGRPRKRWQDLRDVGYAETTGRWWRRADKTGEDWWSTCPDARGESE